MMIARPGLYLFALVATAHSAVAAAGNCTAPLPGPGGNLTWSQADSPVHFCNSATLPSGATVNVDPGVSIVFEPNVTLTVDGVLTGNGTPAEPIALTAPAVFPPVLSVSGEIDFAHMTMTGGQLRAQSGGAVVLSDCIVQSGATVTSFTFSQVPFFDIGNCLFDNAALDAAGFIRLHNVDVIGESMRVSGMIRWNGVTISGSPFAGLYLTGASQPVFLENLAITGSNLAAIDLTSADLMFAPTVSLSGNAYPLQLFSGGVLPGSALPLAGNTGNAIFVPTDGDRFGNNVWSDVGLPYHVTGAYAQRGGQLRILPGTRVLLGPGASIASDPGPVSARGLPDAPVRFERLDPAQAWTSLTQFGRLEHCIVDGSVAGLNWPFLAGYADSCVIGNSGTAAQGVGWVRSTQFIDNDVGADLGAALDLDGTTNPNSFTGNTLAVEQAATAINNWWGSASGPTTSTNPGGSGDVVADGIDVTPFLTTPPDFDDSPPVVTFFEPAFLMEPGARQTLSWEAQDDIGIAGYQIWLSVAGNELRYFRIIADLPPTQTSFEWRVPDIGKQFLSGQSLRVVAIDTAGQQGWDQHPITIPSGNVTLRQTIDTDLAGQELIAGNDIGAITYTPGATGTTVFFLLEGDRGFVSQGAGIIADAPMVSTDLARVALLYQQSSNELHWTVADGYFSVRPDVRLGDAPPVVNLVTPAPGSVFAAGDVIEVSWTASDDSALRNFELQASYDGGRTWQLVAPELPWTTTQYAWQTAPGIGYDDVRIRVVARDDYYQVSSDGSDSVFSLVRTPGFVADLRVDTGIVDFPGTQIGTTEWQTVMLINEGTAPLEVTGLDLPLPQYALGAPALPFTIPPWDSVEVQIGFTPGQLAGYDTTLEVVSNDPDEGLFQLRVNGRGVNVNAPLSRIAPQRLRFGEVVVGESADIELIVSNAGTTDLLILSLVPQFAELSVVAPPPLPITVPPGSQTSITLRLMPQSTGEITGRFWMNTNDSQVGTYMVPVFATGIAQARDTDADLVADRDDNCTLQANTSQIDADGDGFGNRCDADFNNDGQVNFADLSFMKSVFFSADPEADLDGDGSVNFADLSLLKEVFFGYPGPAGAPP